MKGSDVTLSGDTGRCFSAKAALRAEVRHGVCGPAKFETEYSIELSDTLKSMGMELPFDGDHAEFSGIGTSRIGNLYIGRVLHKTYISVAEDGTRAGAATAVEVAEESAMIEEPKHVTLDRPFIYLLIDCETNLPFFIGTMLDPEP